MPLKLVLRPGEKLIVNGAVIGVGDQSVSLFFYNKVNFLRGREILKEEQCDTIEKKLYFIIQLIYIFPEDAETNIFKFNLILNESRLIRPELSDLFDEVEGYVRDGNYYRALKLCRKLFAQDGARDAASDGAETEPPTPASTVSKVRKRPPT